MRRLALLSLLALTVAACDSGPSTIEADSTVIVAYEGRLEDGTVFDRSTGARFRLSQTIVGFQVNLLGMAIGESKTFTVPPEQGYGAGGVVNPNTGEVIIPPNETLTFDVTVLDIL